MKFESGSFTEMKRTILLGFILGATLAFGQVPPKGFFTSLPIKPGVSASSSLMSTNPLPMFNYSIVSGRDGNTYTGTILGRSPFRHGKTTTNIPTQVIPLIITINDGTTTVTYDPTITDPCVTPGTHTDVDVITGSPIFTPPVAPWVMSGVNVGAGQFIDAFQRAEFWSLVAGTPYHLVLNQSTLAAQSLSFNSSQGSNYVASSLRVGGCGNVGVININTLDAAVQNIIKTGPLSGLINTGTFPIFLTHNVVAALSGHSISSQCCALGYHSGFTVGPNLQIYSPFSLDTSGVFGGDVSTLSHEMAEAVNDPTTNNATPPWGGVGQVQPPQCQSNFETGDPLSPGFPATVPPSSSNQFVVVQNGLTYHLQEEAYFSWFFGTPNLGTPGFYSNNSTFLGFAKACPPGGTN